MALKGNELEKRANAVNLGYRKTKRALILKVPVPIILTPKGLQPQQSTVDYIGLVQGGTYIAFDAKETMSKTSFPLANIHQHQLVFLEFVKSLGGYAFFLIHFKELHEDEVYVTPLSVITKYWYGNGRRSIPIKDFDDLWLTKIDSYLDKVIEIKDDL